MLIHPVCLCFTLMTLCFFCQTDLAAAFLFHKLLIDRWLSEWHTNTHTRTHAHHVNTSPTDDTRHTFIFTSNTHTLRQTAAIFCHQWSFRHLHFHKNPLSFGPNDARLICNPHSQVSRFNWVCDIVFLSSRSSVWFGRKSKNRKNKKHPQKYFSGSLPVVSVWEEEEVGTLAPDFSKKRETANSTFYAVKMHCLYLNGQCWGFNVTAVCLSLFSH